MSATSVYFNGRLTYTPGSESEVDASALEAVGLGASGYICIIGTAIGGKPYSAIDSDDVPGTIQKSTRPGQAKTYFKTGSDLLEAEALAFQPSNDADIEAGAQRVYWLKVNASTQSTLSRAMGTGNQTVDVNNVVGSFYADLYEMITAINDKSALITAAKLGVNLVLTSEEYGYDTTQIHYQQGAGTAQGFMITITQASTAEVFDNVGGSTVFTVRFTPTATPSYTTCVVSATAAQLECNFTVARAGLRNDFVGVVTVVGYNDSNQVELISSNPGDTGNVFIVGTDGSGDAISETIALTGAVPVVSVNSYNFISAVEMTVAPVGTVTVRNLGAGPTICTITPAILTRGLQRYTDVTVIGTVLAVTSVPASASRVVIGGLSATGTTQIESIAPGGPTALLWSQIDYLALGEMPNATIVTVTAQAWAYLYATYDTITKLADKINNTHPTFVMTITTGTTGLASTSLDYPAGGPTANTVAPEYLTGGNEGSSVAGQEATPTATASDWQTAIDLLRSLFVNTLVPLTHDTAIHAYLKAHCAYMAGAGKMERDCIVGLMNAGGTAVATKAEAKSQIIDLNTRHIRGVAQQCERFNTSLVKTKFDPPYTAVLAAGMQAGSSVGTSLTHKYIDTLGIYGDSSWSPVDDSDEMIELGLMFAENIDGVGRRWVRNITTHLSSSNIAFTEASVNEATNYATYNLRTEMEAVVGAKGFTGTIQAADGVARGILTLLMNPNDPIITAWRSLAIELSADILELSVEISPVIPVNFVLNTIHLYNAPATA